MLQHSSYQPGPRRSCPDSPTSGTASTLKPGVCPQRAILPAAARSRGWEQRRELRGAAEVSSIIVHLPVFVLLRLFGDARLHHVQKKRTTTQNKNQMQVKQVEGPLGLPGRLDSGFCPRRATAGSDTAGSRSCAFPHRHHDVGANPRSRGKRNAGQGPLLPPSLPCPQYSVFAEPCFKEKYIYIFLLCAFRPLIPPVYLFLSLWT